MNESDAEFSLIVSVPEGGGLDVVARTNRDTILQAYREMQAGRPKAFYDLVDPEVVFSEAPSLPYGGTKFGKEAACAGVEAMFAAWQSLRSELREVLAAGDMVIAYFQMTAVSRATGELYKGPVAELFRFRNGRIIEWRPIYWDTHSARQACGLRC